MSMAMMVAMASRKRDDRGRYMEGENNRRMEGNYGNYNRMGDNGGRMAMNEASEMRRGRDSRGRYMEDDDSARMAYEGNQGRMEQGGSESHYLPWPDPHMPPYLDRPGMNRRMESGGSRMHEEPDGQNPYGGQPEVYRRQEERRSGGEMRRMTDGKTSGGEISYNRPDGGYGNVRYFMHKADPLNQHNDNEAMMEKPRMIGFQHDKEKGQGLDRDTVMTWVEDMEDADGVRGGKFTWHQAQQYANNVGISDKERQLEFYWAMNAMYADYSKAAKKFGVDKPEFYACMAKAFLEDPDAVEDKVKMYNRYIVKHE